MHIPCCRIVSNSLEAPKYPLNSSSHHSNWIMHIRCSPRMSRILACTIPFSLPSPISSCSPPIFRTKSCFRVPAPFASLSPAPCSSQNARTVRYAFSSLSAAVGCLPMPASPLLPCTQGSIRTVRNACSFLPLNTQVFQARHSEDESRAKRVSNKPSLNRLTRRTSVCMSDCTSFIA